MANMTRKQWSTIIVLLIVTVTLYLYDRIYYRDTVAFLVPINIEGDIPIRRDAFGRGEFGARRNGGRTHKGLDILAKIGTPVRAVRSGRVFIGDVPDGIGKYVKIIHSDSLVTRYGHLSKINVRRGRKVRQGDIIGEAGKTGNANHRLIRPHIHFEVRKKGKPVNPLEYLE